ncbi:MAG: ABC transporter substrate-binding protein [Hyphomicrobiaceae bacterium]
MKSKLAGLAMTLMLSAGLAAPTPARAEVGEVILAQQFGIIFTPLMVMESQKMIEKQAAARGMPGLKVTWSRLAGPAVMVDAMLSGSLHFSAQGVPSMALMWDRTRTNVGVHAISAVNDSPIYLNTRNPNIKSLKDYTDKDRIAIPSIKVSSQALYLQMAAEKLFGPGKHTAMDHLVVALSHPDAVAAVLNPAGEITSHFATSPFHEVEKKAGFNTIMSSYDAIGGQSTILTFVTTDKFRKENPKVYEIVKAAFDEAMDYTNADLKRAAQVYIDVSKDKKSTVEELHALMTQPGFAFSKKPSTVGKFAEFMNRIGMIKNKPESWKDMFFPEAHALGGN